MLKPRLAAVQKTCYQNLSAAIVLFLVALPLNIGVAIASGVPAYLGIVSGCIAAVVVGAFSGAPLMVSGPDAGIGVLVLEMIKSHGIEKLGAIVLVAGLMQLICGLVRSANWFRAISPAVVNGMLGGMGAIIVLTQFHIMLDDVPRKTGIDNLLMVPEAIIKGLIPAPGLPHHPAACIGAITIIIAILWGKFAPARLKAVPAPLVAITVASCITAYLALPIQLVKLPANLLSGIQLPDWKALLASSIDSEIWAASATLAFVITAQSLITASAVDSTAKGHKTNFDRELVAQGVGNILCGLLGALPVAGVLLRSMANLQSGATSRAANQMHGIFMLLAVIACPFLLSFMPTSSLAAILVLIGCRMVAGIWRRVKTYERPELVIFFTTLVAILATNLFTGVLIGFVVAAFKELCAIADLGVKLDRMDHRGRMVLHLYGAATFLQLPKLAAALESVPAKSELHVRLDELTYIDHGCLELLMDWGQRHQDQGGEFVIDWGEFETRYTAARHRRRRPTAAAPLAIKDAAAHYREKDAV